MPRSVRITRKKFSEDRQGRTFADVLDDPEQPFDDVLVPQIAIVSPPTPRSYYFLGGLPSFPSRLRDVWSSRR